MSRRVAKRLPLTRCEVFCEPGVKKERKREGEGREGEGGGTEKKKERKKQMKAVAKEGVQYGPGQF